MGPAPSVSGQKTLKRLSPQTLQESYAKSQPPSCVICRSSSPKVSLPGSSLCTCLPFGSSPPNTASQQFRQNWGPSNRSATPLPRPRRSRFEDQIWKGRSRFSLQICSDLHLEFYQPNLELPGIVDPDPPSLLPISTQSSPPDGPPSPLDHGDIMSDTAGPFNQPLALPVGSQPAGGSPTWLHSSLFTDTRPQCVDHSSETFDSTDDDPSSHSAPLQKSALEAPAALNRPAARVLFEQFLQPGRARNLALLGDIGNPEFESYSFFLRWCAKRYERVFVVPGNHEGYGRAWEQSLVLIRNACSHAGSNVHMCDRSTFDLPTVRILATQLWSHVDEDLSTECQRGCSDYALITTEDPTTGEIRNITPADTSSWHAEDLAWLKQQLLEESRVPIVLLTHHAPSMACLEPGTHPTEPFAQLSCSELDNLFVDPIVCWAYGRTHFPLDCRAGTLRLVTNPAGYPRSQFPTPFGRPYRPDLIINL